MADRSIPACAGEPAVACSRASSRAVYPRVCGGTAVPLDLRIYRLGLSPRVRGNPRLLAETLSYGRSIPACAGEPRAIQPVCWITGVYPRVCGGTRLISTNSARNTGLSPRVRGNPDE